MEHRRGHYIPSNAGQFDKFMERIVETASANSIGTPKKWGHIPQDRLNALSIKHITFAGAYEKALKDPTHANIVAI